MRNLLRLHEKSSVNAFLGFLIFCLCVIAYWPILSTPLGADDMWMSSLPSRYWYGTETPIGHFSSQSQFWLDRGRLLTLTLLLETFVFEAFDSREVYKFYLLVLNILVAYSIHRLLALLKFPMVYSMIAILAFLSLGQLRPFFDARLHFAGLQQLIALGIIWVTINILKFRRDRDAKYVSWASLTFILSASLYESIVVFLPMWYLMLAWDSDTKRLRVKRSMLSFYALTGIYVMLTLAVRARATVKLEAYSIGLNKDAILRTYSEQLLGTFPSRMFDTVDVYAQFKMSTVDVNNYALKALWLLALCIFLLAAFNAVSINDQPKLPLEDKFSQAVTVFFSLSCLLLPPILIAISVRWQQDLRTGLPYISVYIQQIGIAILIAFILFRVQSTLKNARYVPVLLTVSILGYVGFRLLAFNTWITDGESPYNNGPMIGKKDIGWNREVLLNTLGENEVNNQIGESRLWFYPQRAWTAKEPVSMAMNRKVEVPNSPNWWTDGFYPIPENCTVPDCRVQPSDLSVFTNSLGYETGIVYFANASEAYMDSKGSSYLVKSGFIFLMKNPNDELFVCVVANDQQRQVISAEDAGEKIAYTNRGVMVKLSEEFLVDTGTLSRSENMTC